jgi:hypothetical protein
MAAWVTTEYYTAMVRVAATDVWLKDADVLADVALIEIRTHLSRARRNAWAYPHIGTRGWYDLVPRTPFMDCTEDEFDAYYSGKDLSISALARAAECEYITTLHGITMQYMTISLSNPFADRITCYSPLCGAVVGDSIVVDPDTDCSICLTRVGESIGQTVFMDRTCRLGCGHVFHRTCVENWVRDKGSCPNCRTSTRSADAFSIGVDQYIKKYVDPNHECSGDFLGPGLYELPVLIGGPDEPLEESDDEIPPLEENDEDYPDVA